MQGTRFLLPFGGAVCIVAVGLFLCNRQSFVQAVNISRFPIKEELKDVFGKGFLKCVLIYESGDAEIVDGRQKLRLTSIRAPAKADGYILGSVSLTGDVALVDSKNVLYRIKGAGKLVPMGPPPFSGDMVAIQFDDTLPALWCAVCRWKDPHPSLVVYLFDFASGHVLAHANLGFTASIVDMTGVPDGGGVLLRAGGVPQVFAINFEGHSLFTKALSAAGQTDLGGVTFDGRDVLFSPRSGKVIRVDRDSDAIKTTYDTGTLRVMDIAIRGNRTIIASGGGNVLTGEGELDVFDTTTGERLGGCGADSSMVTQMAETGPKDSIVYVEERTPPKEYSEANGCRTIALGDDRSASHVWYLGCSNGRYLLISSDMVSLFELPETGGQRHI